MADNLYNHIMNPEIIKESENKKEKRLVKALDDPMEENNKKK